MLSELTVENFAIIDRLSLQFKPGLITFTGETGAGKSIIFDAVETLMGGRADSTVIRSGADRASVEGVFLIPEGVRAEVHAVLVREELLDDPNYVILGREIRLSGRNLARVNGRSVNASLLHELGEYLIDLHGQSEHLSLLRVRQHLGLLDRYAAILDSSHATKSRASSPDGAPIQVLLENYQKAYRRLQEVKTELDRLHQSEQDSLRRSDMLSYQINEIEAAHFLPDEETDLRDERNRLANAEGLASAVQEALVALDDGSPEAPAATDLIGQVMHALSSLARLDPSQTEMYDQSQVLFDGLSDLGRNLRAYLEGIEFNPKRLDHIEERLALLHTLKRKYGDSIPAILEFAERARRQLDEITHASERIQELAERQDQLLLELGLCGERLSARRQAAARQMESAIEAELADLNMTGAQFRVDFERRPDPQGAPLADGQRVACDAYGLERIEFMIAPNPGEGFKPLAKIASGGETSRLMLALKNVLAQADTIPTLIFDEIDQGIGGRVGTIVGKKLWKLARQHQVLCITHLPQLAAFGEQHYQVLKQVRDERTSTLVTALEGQERIQELAQMMGEISDGTLRSARELLAMAEKAAATA